MDQFKFKPARRHQARLRLGIASVSGGGKTMGALRLARGIVQTMINMGICEGGLDGKIAVIDTERKSASLYSHVVPFDTLEMEPPYSVDRMQQALAAAEQAGYVICILDQISHAWAGPGGQLEWIDTLRQSSKNAISPWAKVTPAQQEFYDRLLRSRMHIICTMRSKSEWVIEDVQGPDGRVKKVPSKIGLSPVQREGIEYEFTTMLDIALDSHTATASKDRTGLFADRAVKLDEEVGRQLAEWLLAGEAAPQDLPSQSPTEKLRAEVAAWVAAFETAARRADLKVMFEKSVEATKSYSSLLGTGVVTAQLRVIEEAKDKAKAALEAKESAAGGDPENPPMQEPVQGDPPPLGPLITADDAVALEAFGIQHGLSSAEILLSLSVSRLAELPVSRYAEATELIKLAGKQKKKRGRSVAA